MIASIDSSHPTSRFGCGKIHTGHLGFLIFCIQEDRKFRRHIEFVCAL